MSSEKKNSNKDLKLSLLSLANLVASKHGSVFNVNKNSEQVLALLKWSSESKDKEVNELLMDVGQHVTAAHKRFFMTNGITFEAITEEDVNTVDVTYRGQVIKKDAPTKDVDESKKGKRKIIYRGQEKWV